jgi:hypothetical protein
MHKIKNLAQEYKNGKSMKQILSENPGVSKSTVYHHVRKMNKENNNDIEQVENVDNNDNIELNNLESQNVQEVSDEKENSNDSNIEMSINKAPKFDSFLGGFKNKKDNNMSWSKTDKLDNLLSGFMEEPIYEPKELMKPVKKQEESVKIKPLSWWSKKEKTPKEKQKEEMEHEENERLESIQKIRLYMLSFPDLENLHIVKPDKDKYLISLYTKKQVELDKTLHFMKFHCRNQLSEKTGSKIFENMFKTTCKFSEHLLCMLGMKVNGLTEKVMEDDDIERCLKEICIDHSIHTLSYGPKTDLFLKLGMNIVQLDSQNRIEEKIEQQIKKQPAKENIMTKKLENTFNKNLAEKYNDL